MKKANTGITNLSNLSKLAFALTPISSAERARRRNNRLRAASQRQSSVRATAKRNKTLSPPKRKNSPKRNTPSPPKMKIGARAQLPVVITYPNGRVKVLFRTTKKYYAPNASKQYGFNFSRRI